MLGVTDHYRSADDLPQMLPVFPLRGAIVLPRASLLVNVFEPRYLALLDYALAKDRLIGIVQPTDAAGEGESPPGKDFPLRQVGCVGRITSFTEGDDNHYMITLVGITRFALEQEVETDEPFRLWRVGFGNYSADFQSGEGEEDVDRPRLLATLRSYLEANNLSADWNGINGASNERLVNTLSILSPYGPEEKQALLEAPNLKERAEALVALAEMELASPDDGSGTSLQ